ncbi:hypothetical protein BV20DRAFT_978770 [Pilatotrama ljubarskyi]|nr:hypothetical protein BV20DRAFT_978770 [Pilatotrama ljubarskyi]
MCLGRVPRENVYADADVLCYDTLTASSRRPRSAQPFAAVQQSGKGGTSVLPTTNITAPGGEFESTGIPVSTPFFGQGLQNPNLCNGSSLPLSAPYLIKAPPVTQVIFNGIDIVAPEHFGGRARSVNADINGIREDPGETPMSAGCEMAVSIFAIDYDAPERIGRPIQRHLRKNILSDHLL